MRRKPSPARSDAWSKVEPIRFGPIVAEQHRYERLFYWPDPKSLGAAPGERRARQEGRDRDGAATLAAKSVALQGLPALEYLLYGDGADGLAQGRRRATFRCRFAESIAANVAGIAKDIVEGWQDGAPLRQGRFSSRAPTNAAYHTPKEVTLELFKTFATGIELVRDQKLASRWDLSPTRQSPSSPPSGGAISPSPT